MTRYCNWGAEKKDEHRCELLQSVYRVPVEHVHLWRFRAVARGGNCLVRDTSTKLSSINNNLCLFNTRVIMSWFI